MIKTSEIIFEKVSKEEFDKLKKLFPDDEDTWQRYRQKRLLQLDNNEIEIFAIKKSDEYIGEISTNFISHELSSETVAGKRVYLEAFRVDEHFCGKGLGQQLLLYTISELQKDGYTEFTIGVEENNSVAKHIYFKYGFTDAIATGRCHEFDVCEYTLYMLDTKRFPH